MRIIGNSTGGIESGCFVASVAVFRPFRMAASSPQWGLKYDMLTLPETAPIANGH